MPTVLRSGPYRVFFFSDEGSEPAHVHVERDEQRAKLWLHDVSVASNAGFSARDLGVIIRLVRANREALLESWNAHASRRRGRGP